MTTYEESESHLFILVIVFPICNSGKTIELDDVTFHQCVNLTRFNTEKTVSFVVQYREDSELCGSIQRRQ
jgi:hypothetical protein